MQAERDASMTWNRLLYTCVDWIMFRLFGQILYGECRPQWIEWVRLHDELGQCV